ncbi:TAXI family TRAP transporter solute-binding subunit [Actinocorallia sp. A-T 12471]|uniref:TAXI family TRAP transporter solute-binding subunit n=1 Tax=Actinocorallia sp. A-T 12471 TaxID=3089813 RepID=UPI0029CE3AAD|nr:TAXI family TRAP transporter solute-binding subunit [Actinocorallia sp. A-T 12471]MDX6741562.1 TAXI family TRAP transporter solute-binding subunit [Actinocorallia sp. A-T 12471]
MGRPDEPRIDRSITLHLQGDWGQYNLHRICGWISLELGDRSGPHTRIAIWNGRGGADAVHAVARGQVDIALSTPSAFVTAALDGGGVYAGEAYPHVRALGVLPQRDRLVLGVHKSLGVSSVAELRKARPALSLATSMHDGINHVGWAAHEVLTRSEIDVTGWGGRLLEDERPFDSIAHVRAGRADAIIHEAIMVPDWQEIAPDLTFLPLEPHVLDGLRDDLGWPDAVLPAGYLPGQDELHTLDFSDFLLLTTTDLPDDVAYTIAWILGETRDALERQYRHIPADRSPVTYPLDPVAIGTSPVPLHPGAAAYYAALPR